MYPSRVHNTRNGNDTFPDSPPLISKLIADSGYHCGLIGKFHLTSGGHRPEPRLDDGFSDWWHSHAPRDDWPAGTHDYADWVRERGGDLNGMRESAENISPEFHQTKWASDRAIEFISRDHAQPWLLNINVYDPHPPFVPPQSYSDQFSPDDMPGPYFQDSDLAHQAKLANVDFQGGAARPEDIDAKGCQAKYYAMIAQIDDQFARIMQTLEATRQAENTAVIFTSDHGETLGDHGLIQKGCRFYEGLVRVPLIFSWPGRIQESVQCDGLVELLDMSATILDLCGLDVPDYFQGESLLPILEGKKNGDSIRDFVRCEFFDALDSHFTGGVGSFATMYRDATHKLSIYHDQHLGELYDLTSDPWEFNDLWDDPASQSKKSELVLKSFDAHVNLTTDVGSQRIAPM
jgi:arylsulfatase A-like enzyme